MSNVTGTAPEIASDAEMFRLLMENAQDYAIFFTDPTGRIRVWNSGAERILGYAPHEIIGQICDEIFTPEDRKKGEPERERASAAETGRTEDERWHVRKDGSRFWASGIMTALPGEAGQLRGFVKILRDFTERQQRQREIEDLNQRLQRAMMETHQRVKNNLQVVAALVDMLLQEAGETVPVAEVQRIEQHLRAMAAIHEMLTEAVKAHPDAVGMAASEMLERLVPLLQQTLNDRVLEMEIEPLRLPIAAGCSLAILVNELVSNAAKHGRGTVTLTLRREDHTAALAVCDEGPGFPAGFVSARAAHTGLELIEQISRFDLRGGVRFENLPEGGARVAITFPLPENA